MLVCVVSTLGFCLIITEPVFCFLADLKLVYACMEVEVIQTLIKDFPPQCN